MTTEVELTEPTTDTTPTARATDATGTPQSGTAEAPTSAEPPTPPAEEIEAEEKALYAAVTQWRERDRELQAKFDATFDGDDCEALRRHRQPGLIPVWKKLIENRRRYLAEVVPGIQAEMRRVRVPREQPHRIYRADREKLQKKLLQTLAAMGFEEYAITNSWNNYLEQANEPLEALRIAAENWGRGGYSHSIESEEYQATRVGEEIEKLQKELDAAKLLATGKVAPPAPPAPKPPVVEDEEDTPRFAPMPMHGRVGPRTPAEIVR
jgi:hypothetical protein